MKKLYFVEHYRWHDDEILMSEELRDCDYLKEGKNVNF